MPTFTFSTKDSYYVANPLQPAPPMITGDGHIAALAHGNRTMPMVGKIRTPYIDISLADFNAEPALGPLRNPTDNIRVYADDWDDALAAFAGEEAQQAVAILRASDLAGPDAADPSATDVDFALQLLEFIRGKYAVAASAIAQRRINARAQAPQNPDGAPDPLAGTWDTLTDAEKDVLTTNAGAPFDAEGKLLGVAPVGILTDWDFSPLVLDEVDGPVWGKRGSWSAKVPLVVCEQDYWPYGNIQPLLQKTRVIIGDRVLEQEVHEGPVKTIRVSDSMSFFTDLAALGLITLDTYPPRDFNPELRDLAREMFDITGSTPAPADTIGTSHPIENLTGVTVGDKE